MKQRIILFLLLWASTASQVCAQGVLQMLRRNDSLMTERYRRGNIDTMYIARPQTKWTITARMNVSGAKLEGEGIDAGQHFHSEMEANRKATLSMGISYLGLSLSAKTHSLPSNAAPLPVIFDTDMGNDVDDVLALDLLYKYMDTGHINLLAIMSNQPSEASPRFLDLMNRWYGYAKIPIGTSKGGGFADSNTMYAQKTVALTGERGKPLFKCRIKDMKSRGFACLIGWLWAGQSLLAPLFGCPCGVGVCRFRSATKKPHCCGSWSGGRCCLHAAENETAIEVIIIDEQITGKSLVIEIRLQKLGCALQHAAIFGKLLGIFFFIRPLAAIGFTEIVENGAIITAAAEGCDIDLKGFTLIVIEFGKLTD